jgi:hypothetical protein
MYGAKVPRTELELLKETAGRPQENAKIGFSAYTGMDE